MAIHRLASRGRSIVRMLAVLGTTGLLCGPSAAQRANDAAGTNSAGLTAQSLVDLPSLLRDKLPQARALLVVRKDCPIFEYYQAGFGADTPLRVNSITKSVLSILIGIAIDKHLLGLDQKLADLAPEVSQYDIDARVREISVRNLLTMTSGFELAGVVHSGIPITPKGVWREILNRPIAHGAGSQFLYDDQGANLLSDLLAGQTNQDEEHFAKTYLLDPMGITNYDWPSDPEGHLMGDGGLYLTLRDMGKLGLLYLHRGRWRGAQLVSEAYVDDSTTEHSAGGPPARAAYGYLWWVGKTKTGLDAFFAAGFGGQLIYVVPKLDLVVALASQSHVPRGSVNFVNDIVLPAAAATPDAPKCESALQ